MKLKKISLILALVVLCVACTQEPRIVTLHLKVAELICEDGQNIFESRILDLKGIRSVTANIDSQLAEVRFRDSDISADEILKHLQTYGFSVNGVAGNEVARSRLPSCCLHNTSHEE